MTEPPKLQIDDKHWLLVDTILKKYLSDCEIYVFGSRARMDAKTYSDLDLAVEADQPLSHQTLTKVAMAFEESDLPWAVDLIDLKVISPSFRAAIAPDLVLTKAPSEASAY